MPTLIVLATIAGAAIAFVFFLIEMKEREAGRKGLLISGGTGDPFTGTWREKGGLAEKGRMAIKPNGDGLSFQYSVYQDSLLINYGEEFVDQYQFLEILEPIMTTVVRVDSHTLEFSYRSDGRPILKNTYTASSDGKHLIAVWEYSGGTNASAIYDRVGWSHKGDAFFGTWRSGTYLMKIKAYGETIDWFVGDIHVVKAKFDGEEYKGDNSSNKTTTYKFKRLDDHRIEMVMKSELSYSNEAWQVHNNMLTRTATYIPGGDQTSGTPMTSISKYERVR